MNQNYNVINKNVLNLEILSEKGQQIIAQLQNVFTQNDQQNDGNGLEFSHSKKLSCISEMISQINKLQYDKQPQNLQDGLDLINDIVLQLKDSKQIQTNSLFSIIGDMFATSFCSPGFTWYSNPIQSELEIFVCDWIADLTQLPSSFHFQSKEGGGTMINSISEAYFLSINVAKQQKIQELGINKFDKKVFTFAGFYVKATQTFSKNALELKDIQHQYLLNGKDCKEIDEEINRTVQKEQIPFWLGIQLSQCDINDEIKFSQWTSLQQKYNLYLHIDLIPFVQKSQCEETKEGKINFKKRKVINTSLSMNLERILKIGPPGCFFYVSSQDALKSATSGLQNQNQANATISNVYSGSKDIVDYKDWTVGFGRRFSSLKVFLMIIVLGQNKLQEMLVNLEE